MVRKIQGVGYVGEGKYLRYVNNVKTPQYSIWTNMLKRCYSDKEKDNYPSYYGCTVAEEWHNFQNFAQWYDNNYYEIEGDRMCLDKDILVKGNKVYSPDTCIFVPNRINSLFLRSNRTRGDLPIGVTFDKRTKKYMAQCRTLTGLKFLGRFPTVEEAFGKYKEFKEQYIKQVAEEYKHNIPHKLFRAMLNYQVEVSD